MPARPQTSFRNYSTKWEFHGTGLRPMGTPIGKTTDGSVLRPMEKPILKTTQHRRINAENLAGRPKDTKPYPNPEETLMKTRTTAEWLDLFDRADVPALPMHSFSSVLEVDFVFFERGGEHSV